MNLRFIKHVLFVLLLLPTMLFAHETRLETPFTPKSFASRIGINADGNSIIAWDAKQGGVVYILENDQWELKTFLTPESSSAWRRVQSLDVSGNYAAFTSYPDKQIHVYRWNNDNKTWDFYKKFEHRFSSSVIIKITDSGTVLIQDYGNGIIDIYNPHLNRFTKQITNPEDGVKLDGYFEINGNLLLVSSRTNTFVYKNYSLVAKLPSAYAFSSNGANTIALRPNNIEPTDVHIYRYDNNLNENGGWYKAETILAPPISNSIDSHGISGNGNNFGHGGIKLFGNKIYIADIVDLDGQYGIVNNTSNNNHSIIYEYNLIDGEWEYKRAIIPADFSHNYNTWNFILSRQGDKLVLGDSTAHWELNSDTRGAAYVFNLNDTTDLTLDVSVPESHQIIGDIVSYQFQVTNNSENTATNVTFEKDYNPNIGLWDSKNDSDLRYISALSSQGLCTNQSYDINRVTCNIGDLSPGESVDITIEMSPEFVYEINTFARVYADQFDSYYDDNFKLVSINVSSDNVNSYASTLEYDYPNYNHSISDKGVFAPSLSADGKFVSLYSYASLTERVNSSYKNVFTADRENSSIEISSIPDNSYPSYHQANGDSYQPKISNDGDLVAFSSRASNIVENDTNKQLDVFLHRRSTGENYRISESYYGEGGDKASYYPDISADGRYVVFASRADNLYSSDNNGDRDLYIYNVNNRNLTWVDLSQSGIDGLRIPNAPSISGDGTYISFTGKTSQGYAAYLWNKNTWKAKKISPDYNPDGTISTSPGKTEVSDNGNYVTYALDGNIYKYNIQTEENELISVGINLETANGSSSIPSISADGKYIVYKSFANNLIEDDTNGFADIFVYDSASKTTRRVNKGVGGVQTKNHCSSPTISADGNTIAYVTKAHNLVFDDTNEVDDIFFEGNPFTTEPEKKVDLLITKTTHDSKVTLGSNVTYTIAVDNISADTEATATNVEVEDELPPGLIFDSVTASKEITCGEDLGTVSCFIDEIAVNDEPIEIKIVTKTTATGKIENTATVSAKETDLDNQNNNSTTTVDVVETTDIALSGPESPIKIAVGDELKLDYVISNISANSAPDVTATFNIPEQLGVSYVEINEGTCSINASDVTCIISEVASDDINISITTVPNAIGDYKIASSVETTKTDSDASNNSHSVDVNVVPVLSIEASDSSDPVLAGDTVTYTVEITNNSVTAMENAQLLHTRLNQFKHSSMTSSSGSCIRNRKVVTCDFGTIDGLAAVTFELTLQTKAGAAAGTYDNPFGFSATHKSNPITSDFIEQTTIVRNANLVTVIKGAGKGTVTAESGIINCPGDCKENGMVTGDTVTLTATPDATSVFQKWTGVCKSAGTNPVCTISLKSGTNKAVANFIKQPKLTVKRKGAGKGSVSSDTTISCPGVCDEYLPSGTEVTLTATPNEGSSFDRWTGACKNAGKNPVCTTTITKNVNAVANFIVNPTLTASIKGKGTVNSIDGGIACPGDCKENYPVGDTVTLTATADSGYMFSKWTGACKKAGTKDTCEVTVTKATKAVANFIPLPTIKTVISGSGTVESDDGNIACPGDCSQQYEIGTTITLTATPDQDSGAEFNRWTGVCKNSSDNICTYTVNDASNKTVRAIFR